jgi:hypothetical protein
MSAGAFWSVRLGLYGLGACLLVVGTILLFGRPTGPRLVGIVVWLGCAILLHDAILVPALTIAGRLRDAAGRRVGLPRAATHIVDAAIAVGGVLTLAVLPELWAQHLGPANPTVLPDDYGPRLLAVWGMLALVAAAGVVAVTLRARRVAAAR